LEFGEESRLEVGYPQQKMKPSGLGQVTGIATTDAKSIEATCPVEFALQVDISSQGYCYYSFDQSGKFRPQINSDKRMETLGPRRPLRMVIPAPRMKSDHQPFYNPTKNAPFLSHFLASARLRYPSSSESV
jgi:hypothetical protein